MAENVILLTVLPAFYGVDSAAKSLLVAEVRRACLEKGFFQIVNHGVAEELQREIFQQSKALFSLPHDVKESYDKGEFPS